LILTQLPHLIDRFRTNPVESQCAEVDDRSDDPRVPQQLAAADVCAPAAIAIAGLSSHMGDCRVRVFGVQAGEFERPFRQAEIELLLGANAVTLISIRVSHFPTSALKT